MEYSYKAIKSHVNDVYKDVKDRLNKAAPVIDKVARNPISAYTAKSNSGDVLNAASGSGFPGPAGGQQDAFRHILWAAETRKQVGEMMPGQNPDVLDKAAREVLLANEDLAVYESRQNPQDKAMDVHNNDIGIQIGKNAVNKISSEDLERDIKNIVLGSDGKGINDTPFWYDESDPSRIPPQNDSENMKDQANFTGIPEKPLTVGEELRRAYRKTMGLPEENPKSEEKEHLPPQRTEPPEPDDAEVDPQTGKRFGDMGVAEYLAALHRWLKGRKANDNAPHANQNLKETDSGGEVRVKAHSREGGKEQVRGYTRGRPHL